MISKGPSPVTHTDPGDDTTVARSSRRSLLGAGIGAGVLGVAFAAATGQTIGAVGTATDEGELLARAMQLELTARDLYDEAIAAGASAELPSILREQHEAYAQAIAGATGRSANARNQEVFDALRASFATADDAAVATAGYELESIASATHTSLLGSITDLAAARLVASIAVVEARHAAVLAAASGQGDDLDALLVNSADPLILEDLS